MAGGALFGITLWSTDVFQLADFLVEVAGLEALQRHPGFASLRSGDVLVNIHDDESYRGHPWFEALGREGVARGIGAEMRFQVGSASDAFTAALRLGGQAIASPFEYENTLECQVMGPDGYVLGLWQVWNSSTLT